MDVSRLEMMEKMLYSRPFSMRTEVYIHTVLFSMEEVTSLLTKVNSQVTDHQIGG